MNLIAQVPRKLGPTIGADGLIDPGTDPAEKLSTIIGSSLMIIFVVGGLTAFFVLIMGGFSIITSGGDEAKLADGRNKIMWALIGLLVLLGSWALIVLVQEMFDVCFGIGCSQLNLESLRP